MTTHSYEDVYELLKAMKGYAVENAHEVIIPTTSIDGTVLGFATADTEKPSTVWEMNVRLAKASAASRHTREGDAIRGMLASFTGRKELLLAVLEGSILLLDPFLSKEEVFAFEAAPIESPVDTRQYLIAGL